MLRCRPSRANVQSPAQRAFRARRYAPRPYELVVLSDHGQTQGATFKCAATFKSGNQVDYTFKLDREGKIAYLIVAFITLSEHNFLGELANVKFGKDFLCDARARFSALSAAHPDSAELAAARGGTAAGCVASAGFAGTEAAPPGALPAGAPVTSSRWTKTVFKLWSW